MRPIIIRQLVITTTLTLIALLLYQGLAALVPIIQHPVFYALLGWFFFQDALLGVILRHAANSPDPKKFVAMFQIAFGTKFIFAMVILLMLVMKFPDFKRVLAFQFLALYVFFLLADTLLLLRLLNRK